MSKPVFSDSQVIGQLNSGYKWYGTSISYSFLQTAPSWSFGGEGNGFSAFTSAQAAAARSVMALWDGLIAPSLVEQFSNRDDAQINFANTSTDIVYAHAYPPGNYGKGGSVWLNAGTYTDFYSPFSGGYEFMSMLHEVGHSLGLNHPGLYNGGSPTYEDDADYAQDTHQWTVMSYFDAENSGADWTGANAIWQYAQTPMVHDILAIQAIYGADTTTRTGNTTYGFNSNADNGVFNFALNKSPVLSIYDAGGIDTLDLSGFTQRAQIDLRPGMYSSAGGVSGPMTYNIGIAANTWIENAIGGSGNDSIIGNSLDNILTGNAGDDHFYGLGGNDTLHGGTGTDYAHFDLSFASYTFEYLTFAMKVMSGAFDTVYNDIEWYVFADVSKTLNDIFRLMPTRTLETYGDYDLLVNGGQYRIAGNGGSEVVIIMNGSAVGPSSFGSWAAIQAEEKAGGGYSVLWKTSDSTNYGVWDLNASGNFQSSRVVSAANLVDVEELFEVDFNGDGRLGRAPIETSGDYDLLVKNGQFQISANGAPGVGIIVNGSAVGPSSYSAWSAVQAEEKVGGGYSVLWKASDSSSYGVWDLNASGQLQSSRVLSAANLADVEQLFEVDLNGDGRLGRAPIETSGDYDLLVNNGQFQISANGGPGVGIIVNGSAVGPSSYSAWSAVQAEEKAGGGYSVLWKASDSSSYGVWDLDPSGHLQSSRVLSAANLADVEQLFEVDLNGDGRLGRAPIETSGDYDLLVNNGQFQISANGGPGVGIIVNGSAVGPSSYSAWSAVQAEEKVGGGYSVLWKASDSSSYGVWDLDASGHLQSSRVLAAANLADVEQLFEADLNGDGRLGRAPIETNGDFDLLVSGGQYRISANGGSEVGISVNGSAVGPSSYSAWSAVQAEEKVGGGYSVLWKASDSSNYGVWDLDASGQLQSSRVVSAANLYSLEQLFEVDLNGDGRLGQTPPAHSEPVNDYLLV